MGQPLLSIVIPVYNSQQWLGRCLDSICSINSNGGHDIEVICVDDGSTDGSSELLEIYRRSFTQIRVVTQSNMGKSVARNRGIDAAVGDYVTFADSDDFFLSNAFEELLPRLRDGRFDAVFFMWETKFNDGSTILLEPGINKPHEVNGLEVACELIRPKGAFQGSVYGKVIRRSLLNREPLIRFSLNIEIAEDQLFWFSSASRINKALLVPQALYEYQIRGDSESSAHGARAMSDSVLAYRKIIEMCRRRFPSAVSLAEGRLRTCVVSFAAKAYITGDSGRVSQIISLWKEFQSLPMLPTSFFSRRGKIEQSIIEILLKFHIPAGVIYWPLHLLRLDRRLQGGVRH